MTNKYLINRTEYAGLCLKVFELIESELENPKDTEMSYPKFIIMYEFFRLLRGDAFLSSREPVGDYQKELYKMEDTILKKVKELRAKLPHDLRRSQYYYDLLIPDSLKISHNTGKTV